MKKMFSLSISLLTLIMISQALAQSPTLPATVPEGYVNASTILQLPDFIPGSGALYIDPANAPTGPWLAYGKDGNLIELLYMVPVAKMDAAESWDDLGAGLIEQLGVSVDHVDVTYNGGHPGMAEAHYHIRLAFVDHDTQQAALTE